jgi:hypothetical protein
MLRQIIARRCLGKFSDDLDYEIPAICCAASRHLRILVIVQGHLWTEAIRDRSEIPLPEVSPAMIDVVWLSIVFELF